MDFKTFPQPTDAILVSNYISGSEIALEALITRHKLRIFNFIKSKVLDVDTAEDLFQDTFIKVIKTLKTGTYNEQGKFLPWVMRIVHDGPHPPEFVEKALFQDQIIKDLQKLVHELPEDQKEVLIMRLYRDMSFKEIAENTNVSINTALGRMRYAIINIRKLVEVNQIILD